MLGPWDNYLTEISIWLCMPRTVALHCLHDQVFWLSIQVGLQHGPINVWFAHQQSHLQILSPVLSWIHRVHHSLEVSRFIILTSLNTITPILKLIFNLQQPNQNSHLVWLSPWRATGLSAIKSSWIKHFGEFLKTGCISQLCVPCDTAIAHEEHLYFIWKNCIIKKWFWTFIGILNKSIYTIRK
jgi:hypothetical protein